MTPTSHRWEMSPFIAARRTVMDTQGDDLLYKAVPSP